MGGILKIIPFHPCHGWGPSHQTRSLRAPSSTALDTSRLSVIETCPAQSRQPLGYFLSAEPTLLPTRALGECAGGLPWVKNQFPHLTYTLPFRGQTWGFVLSGRNLLSNDLIQCHLCAVCRVNKLRRLLKRAPDKILAFHRLCPHCFVSVAQASLTLHLPGICSVKMDFSLQSVALSSYNGPFLEGKSLL